MTNLRTPGIELHAWINDIEDIRRKLLLFRYAPEFAPRSQRVPICRFAALCGISRQMLYHLMSGKYNRVHKTTYDRLAAGMDWVFGRGLRWRRGAGRRWYPLLPDGSRPTLPTLPPSRHMACHDRPQL